MSKLNKTSVEFLVEQGIAKAQSDLLTEGLFGWASGLADKVVSSIINRNTSDVKAAILSDPKLTKLANGLGMNHNAIVKRVMQLAAKDPDFIKALATQRAKRV